MMALPSPGISGQAPIICARSGIHEFSFILFLLPLKPKSLK
ncbi:hypothetical protein [Komagataeibacter swingsii]|nr:hypothetical protein [Komagataeibacter swingsii]